MVMVTGKCTDFSGGFFGLGGRVDGGYVGGYFHGGTSHGGKKSQWRGVGFSSIIWKKTMKKINMNSFFYWK